MAVFSPSNLNEALTILREPELMVVAGGTDYFPALKQRKKHHKILNLFNVREMNKVTSESGGLRIGASVTWSEIIKLQLPAAFNALKVAARQVGSIQIQNAATLAGNLCNASPAADGIPPLLILDAEIEMQSAERGKRQMPLCEFLQGIRSTARRKDELVTSIYVPRPPTDLISSFSKLGSRSHLVISVCMTATGLVLDNNNCIIDLRVAVGACSPVAQRLHTLEREVIGSHRDTVSIMRHHLSPLSPIDDFRGTAAFRLEAVREQIHRLLSLRN